MEEFIKEFWPVAFVLVAMFVSFLRNSLKVKEYVPETPPTDTLSEEFPMVEIMEPQRIDAVPDISRRSAARSVAPRKKSEQSHKPLSKQPSQQAEKPRVPKITMRGKSEAKRAFIYSEIFNRKY